MKGEPGKAPAFQFYIKDWLTDTNLRLTSASTRGIWIDLLCHMWGNGGGGKICLNSEQIMKLTGANQDEVDLFFLEAKTHNFCECVTKSNGMSQICNRRMRREFKARENNRLRQQKHREKKARNSDVKHQKGGAPSPSPTPTPIPNANIKEKATPRDVQKKLKENIGILEMEAVFEDAAKFVYFQKEKGKDEEIICHALSQLIKKCKNGNGTFEQWSKKRAWGYCEKIVYAESQVKNARDSEAEAEGHKEPIGDI